VLAQSVVAVHQGQPVVSPSLTAHLVRGLRRDGGEPRAGTTGRLTSSELNVLRLVADGRTDKQISQTLYISPRTVQTHLSQIRAKTGVQRRTQLARWARVTGESLFAIFFQTLFSPSSFRPLSVWRVQSWRRRP